MSVAEWTDIHGIHHWRIVWSSYRNLAWVGFEPIATEFRSDALTDWAIRSWVQVALRANFVQLHQFHRLFNVRFHFGCCIHQSPSLFNLTFLELITWVKRNELIYRYGIHDWRIVWIYKFQFFHNVMVNVG